MDEKGYSLDNWPLSTPAFQDSNADLVPSIAANIESESFFLSSNAHMGKSSTIRSTIGKSEKKRISAKKASLSKIIRLPFISHLTVNDGHSLNEKFLIQNILSKKSSSNNDFSLNPSTSCNRQLISSSFILTPTLFHTPSLFHTLNRLSHAHFTLRSYGQARTDSQDSDAQNACKNLRALTHIAKITKY